MTSGRVVTLLDAGLDFDWVAGISAGASNAVNHLSGDARRARRSFVDFAADEQFGGLRYFARGQGMFNAEYIYQQATRPCPSTGSRSSQVRATCGTLPSMRAPVTMSYGHDKTHRTSMTSWFASVRPRRCPDFMPPVHLDGHVYVDGAMGQDGGIALSQAQREGLEKFVIVLTQERSYWKVPQRLPAMYRQIFRQYPALGEALLTRWSRYNETRERIFALEAEDQAHVFARERMTVDNGTRDLSRLAAAHRMRLS